MSDFELAHAIICDQVVVDRTKGTVSAINIFNTIGAKSFPAMHPKLTTLVRIKGEPGKKVVEKIDLVNTNGDKVVASVSGDVVVGLRGFNSFIGEFNNIIFDSSGTYWIKVLIDDKVLSNRKMHFFDVKTDA